MKPTRALCACGLIGLILALARPAAAGEVVLELSDDAGTGIRAIFDQWHADELKAQGGKFGDHGWWPWGLRAFDLDNDGDLDLIASHHGAPRSIILKNQTAETGKFTFVNVTAELGVPRDDLPVGDDRPWIWDFDGDGFLDIASLTDEGKKPILFNQAGKKLQIGPTSFTNGGLAHPHEIVDLNADGYPDVDGGYKGRFLYDPAGRQFKHLKEPLPTIPPTLGDEFKNLKDTLKKDNAKNRFLSVTYMTHFLNGSDTLGSEPAAIDLNVDGIGDLIIAGAGGYGGDYLGRYLVGKPDGSYESQAAALGLPEEGCPIYYGDLSGDGAPDLLIVDGKTGGMYLNDGKGKFSLKANSIESFLKKRGPYLLRTFRVDLDNDGDFDLVLSNPRGKAAEVHRNDGQGEFKKILNSSGWDSNPIVIADFNHDGKMDIAIGTYDEKKNTTIAFFMNKTEAGHFAQIFPRDAKPNPYAIGAVVEVFRDGDMAKPDARPLLAEKAHPDATPVHVGLGAATTFDLRITFAGGRKVEYKGLQADRRFTADPAGKTAELK